MRKRSMKGLRLRISRGQSTVEYALVISVIAIAMYATSQYFVEDFQNGFEAMQENTAKISSDGVVGE